MKTMTRRMTALFLTVILLLAGCGKAPAAGGGAAPVGTAVSDGTGKGEATILAAAIFPEWPKRKSPDKPASEAWQEMNKARTITTMDNRDLRAKVAAFSTRYFSVMMQGQENVILSPVTTWLALGMLAEVTAGDTQAEILTALQCTGIEECRDMAQKLVKSVYIDDGVSRTVPACAFFLSDKEEYREEPLRQLADVYLASAFSGTMGSKEYDAFLQAWLDQQTGGMLTDEASAVKTDPDEVLALAAAMYLKTPWEESFAESAVAERPFETPSGQVKTEFMTGPASVKWYVQGNGWKAAYRSMQGGMTMWFILPDEGVDPAAIAQDPALTAMLTAARPDEVTEADVMLTVPMFDVSSSADIVKKLPEMGIRLALDENKADFSPLLPQLSAKGIEVCVSKVDTAARVKIDTAGVEASAFTVIHATKALAPQPLPQVYLVFDRPFLFAVTGPNGVVEFAGLVNSPAE